MSKLPIHQRVNAYLVWLNTLNEGVAAAIVLGILVAFVTVIVAIFLVIAVAFRAGGPMVLWAVGAFFVFMLLRFLVWTWKQAHDHFLGD